MPAYDYIGVEHEFRSFLIGEEGDGKAHKVSIKKGAVSNEYLEDEKAHHYFCVSAPVKLFPKRKMASPERKRSGGSMKKLIVVPHFLWILA